MDVFTQLFLKRGRRAVVLCDGTAPPTALLARCLRDADCFVCTDAAGYPYDRLPRKPDLVIGDFDTLGEPAPSESDITFQRVPEQESSDSEKALQWLCAQGVEEAILLGATGGRLDHSLFNVLLLGRFAGRLRLCLADDHGISMLLTPGTDHFWSLPADTLFSLIPMTESVAGVTVEGAAYPLAAEEIGVARRNTLSNRVIASPLHVRFETGSLLICVETPFDSNRRAVD